MYDHRSLKNDLKAICGRFLSVRFNYFGMILAMEGMGINASKFLLELEALAMVLTVPQIFKLLGAPMMSFC